MLVGRILRAVDSELKFSKPGCNLQLHFNACQGLRLEFNLGVAGVFFCLQGKVSLCTH